MTATLPNANSSIVNSNAPKSDSFLPAMTRIAREAGALLMENFQQNVKVEYKGEADLVTIADRKSEALIRERIRQQWPTHDILGEEGGLQDTGSDYRWYVDPLDGTTNFAHGFPVFCVSMALEYKGEVIAGVVFDPTRDELFAAEKGSGARLNDRPIHVSKTTNLAECLVATGFPSHKRHKNPNIFFYHHITLRTHGVRRAGSAALDLCYVACGRFDAFWEFKLNPWDTAAGVLLVEEAGGKVTDFAGGPFQLNSKETLASNRLVHSALLHEFEQIFEGNNLEPLPSVQEYRR
ncbi:MAG TPA: inositol monophosphatase family protein [Terriglobales bacterium]|nr:inositol monophosphatase family protein [Terriglobales bacterium]